MTKEEKEFEEGLARVKKYHEATKDQFGKVLKDASEDNLEMTGALAGNTRKPHARLCGEDRRGTLPTHLGMKRYMPNKPETPKLKGN
jgi:hypothetical protein